MNLNAAAHPCQEKMRDGPGQQEQRGGGDHGPLPAQPCRDGEDWRAQRVAEIAALGHAAIGQRPVGQRVIELGHHGKARPLDQAKADRQREAELGIAGRQH